MVGTVALASCGCGGLSAEAKPPATAVSPAAPVAVKSPVEVKKPTSNLGVTVADISLKLLKDSDAEFEKVDPQGAAFATFFSKTCNIVVSLYSDDGSMVSMALVSSTPKQLKGKSLERSVSVLFRWIGEFAPEANAVDPVLGRPALERMMLASVKNEDFGLGFFRNFGAAEIQTFHVDGEGLTVTTIRPRQGEFE